jgi:hypothetical protein
MRQYRYGDVVRDHDGELLLVIAPDHGRFSLCLHLAWGPPIRSTTTYPFTPQSPTRRDLEKVTLLESVE